MRRFSINRPKKPSKPPDELNSQFNSLHENAYELTIRVFFTGQKLNKELKIKNEYQMAQEGKDGHRPNCHPGSPSCDSGWKRTGLSTPQHPFSEITAGGRRGSGAADAQVKRP
jgi:hypothetical protein